VVAGAGVAAGVPGADAGDHEDDEGGDDAGEGGHGTCCRSYPEAYLGELRGKGTTLILRGPLHRPWT